MNHGHDDVHLAANEFGREPWEPFVLVLGESVFKDNGLASDITEFTQARAKLRERNGIGSCAAEKPDPIYPARLLCLDSERCGEGTSQRGQQEAATVNAEMASRAARRCCTVHGFSALASSES